MFLLTDGAQGIYQAQMLVNQYPVQGLSATQIETLRKGPYTEGYEEAEEALLEFGSIDNQGKTYRLEMDQEGIFAILVED